MAEITIQLNDKLKIYLDKKVERDGYNSVDELLSELIRRDQQTFSLTSQFANSMPEPPKRPAPSQRKRFVD